MEGFIMLGGIVGFIICVLMLLVKAIRKKPKKKTAIAAVVCLAVAIFMYITWGSEPYVVSATYDTLEVGVLSEIKGDITEIEKYSDMYFIRVDDEYVLITTPDVEGHFPSEGDRNVRMWVIMNENENVSIVSFPDEDER